VGEYCDEWGCVDRGLEVEGLFILYASAACQPGASGSLTFLWVSIAMDGDVVICCLEGEQCKRRDIATPEAPLLVRARKLGRPCVRA
jgi:hypothetical protein